LVVDEVMVEVVVDEDQMVEGVVVTVGIKVVDLGEVVAMTEQIGGGDVVVVVMGVQLQWIVDRRKLRGPIISNSSSHRRSNIIKVMKIKHMMRRITEVVNTRKWNSMIRPGKVVKVVTTLILILDTMLLIGMVDTNMGQVEAEVVEVVGEEAAVLFALMLRRGAVERRREKLQMEVTHNNKNKNSSRPKIMTTRQR